MLGRAAERFIRTKWASIQELAEELYAVFSPQQPIEASQIIINQSSDNAAPPFIINRAPGSDGSSIQINHNGGEGGFNSNIDIHGDQFGPSNFNLTRDQNLDSTFAQNFGDLNLGGTTYGSLDFKGSTFNMGDFTEDPTGGHIRPGSGGIDLGKLNFPGQDPSSRTAAIPSPTFNPFLLYGEVQAKQTGQTFSVKCWAKAPASSPVIGIIDVRFPMVDPSETIPAGTACPVMCFPGLDPANVEKILDAIGFIPTFLPSS